MNDTLKKDNLYINVSSFNIEKISNWKIKSIL